LEALEEEEAIVVDLDSKVVVEEEVADHLLIKGQDSSKDLLLEDQGWVSNQEN
jgi:hypothetical protein